MALPPLDALAMKFHNDVLAPYAKVRTFCKEQNSVGNGELRRLMLECASALFHFREHLPIGERRSRSFYTTHCPDYGLVGDLANAFKHHELTRNMPLVTCSANIFETLVVVEYEDDEGPYTDSEAVVHVKLSDGSVQDIGEVLQNVVNMWQLKMWELGADEKHRPFKRVFAPPVCRPDARKSNLTITQGVACELHIKPMKYDYATTMLTQTGLSQGDKVLFRAWKCPALTLHCMGEEVETEIPVSGDEYEQYCSLESDEARTNFLRRIAERDGHIAEAAQSLQQKLLASQRCWSIICL